MFIRKIILLGIIFWCYALPAQVSEIEKHFEDSFYNDVFVGFSLYDITQSKPIYEYNANKLFTPASNTKILTLNYFIQNDLYKDSISAIRYTTYKNKIFVQGLGDPTTLNPKFNSTKVIDFLKNQKRKIYFIYSRPDFPYREGWSLDDINKGWLTEINSFPMYGNEVTINVKKTIPNYFKDAVYFYIKNERKINENIFYSSNGRGKFAYITDEKTVENIVEEALGKNIKLIDTQTFDFSKISNDEILVLKSFPYAPVLKEMMKMSDNFLANQLNYIAENNAYKLSENAQFKLTDGSGQSRYNLISPNQLVDIILEMYRKVPFEELKDYFAINGQYGSLEKVLPNEKPFIYAKTGTLKNNHTLSGFLVADSGKVYAFSFMNNHYLKSIEEIKEKMYKLLLYIKKNY